MGNDEITGLNYCYSCMRKLDEGETACPDCGHDSAYRSNPDNTLPEGTILNGKYLVGKVLGQGGFGITYLGFDLSLQVRVAIKEYFPIGVGMRAQNSIRVISAANLSDPEGFEKGCREFQSEAQTLTRFNSPNIVRLRDYFRENGTAYIVMDYIEGNTLTKEVEANGGKLPWERVLDLFEPLILEMDKLHKKHLIHRDIKPDNLKISVDDYGGEHLVLLDFGAARSFVSAQVTKTYTALVTPGYAPMEQYSPKSRQGPYTDIYSLCATMYAVITGEVPPVATDRMMGQAEVHTFMDTGLSVPERVEKAILHGMEVMSENRQQTMLELYEELTGRYAPVETISRRITAQTAAISAEQQEEKTAAEKTVKETSSGSKKALLLIPLLLILLAGGFFFYRNLQQGYQNIAVTQTAIFLQSEQETHDKETQSAIDTENTRAAQEKETQSALDAESTRTVQEQETQAAIREQNTRSAQEQMTEQALQRLALQATGTQEVIYAEETAASFGETKQAELHRTETQSVVYAEHTRTAEAGQMQQTVRVETQWAQQTQSAQDSAHTATAWIATQDAGLQQTLTQSALNFQNTQTVSVQQTAQAQGTADAIERTREAEAHQTETQNAVYIAGTQDALTIQTSQAQKTADALERTREAELILIETQNAVYIAGTQDALTLQTAQAQGTANALERTREAELHLTETQNAVHAASTQDALTRQTAQTEGTAAALERTRETELRQTETQSSFDMRNTQEACEQQTAQAVQTAAAWKNTQEAISMIQTDIVRTMDVIYAEQTRAAWMQTQEAVNGMLTEVAQTQEAVSAVQTKAAEPTATKTPEPVATSTPKPAETKNPEPAATDTPEPTATLTPTKTNTPRPTPIPVRVGDFIRFGVYEQDNNLDNGPEEIEWQVLDVQGNRALLISRYGLDTERYNEEYVSVTWETCTLRTWLNNEFYNSAFNSSDQAQIIEVMNENPNNSDYGTKGGNSTKDKVFLLTVDEANKYLSPEERGDRFCRPTAYARANGAWASVSLGGISHWWLRSPGYNSQFASSVDHWGYVLTYGTGIYSDNVVVRPALWLDITSSDGSEREPLEEITETPTPTEEPRQTPTIGPAADLTALGNEAYQMGDYEKALDWYQQAADQGNEEAKVMAVLTRNNAVKSSNEIVLYTDVLMRNDSSANAAVMRSILKGSLITLTGNERNEWVQIQTQEGQKGWIPKTVIPSSIIAFIEEQLHGFGQYEQDNNLSNGPEPIEWKVLAVEDDRALVISRYGLDAKPYNEKQESVTWETCTLRAWLNNEFYNNAFSSSEQRQIIEVTNPDYGNTGDNSTRDKVFLPSIDESLKYFDSDEARRCEATAYAKANGAWVSDRDRTSVWWLGPTDCLENYASIVHYDGSVGMYCTLVSVIDVAVRPAFWLSL